MAQKPNTKDRNRLVALEQLTKSMNLVLETMLLKKNYTWVQVWTILSTKVLLEVLECSSNLNSMVQVDLLWFLQLLF